MTIKHVLIPIPSRDFDPTESAIPWKILNDKGVKVSFATPKGLIAECDMRMLKGTGLGPLKGLLAADKNAVTAYQEMEGSPAFRSPLSWGGLSVDQFDGILLPGGHAQGMKEFLESEVLQKLVSKFFENEKPVAAICHGVVLAARSQDKDGKSCLYGRKTTSLLCIQEMIAWLLTFLWLGNYYRTYSISVQKEVQENLEKKTDFIIGPIPLDRDKPDDVSKGFVVRDGNYVSARWPGDAHLFANTFLEILNS